SRVGAVHRGQAPSAGPRRGAAAAAPAAGRARARHDGRRSRAPADSHDARAHAGQQDARRRNPRHVAEDAPQQVEQAATQEESGVEGCQQPATCVMRLGIKGKQVLGVTTIVGVVVVVLSVIHLARLAQVKLDESKARAELLANAVFHRAYAVVGERTDPYVALHSDAGLRSILESSLYSPSVTFAAIVDAQGVAVAHTDPALEGNHLPRADDVSAL